MKLGGGGGGWGGVQHTKKHPAIEQKKHIHNNTPVIFFL